MAVEDDIKQLQGKVAELAQALGDLASAVESLASKANEQRVASLAGRVRITANHVFSSR